MRTPWRFYDSVDDETYFLEVNPKEDKGSHAIQKSVTYSEAVATYVDMANELHVDEAVVFVAPNEQEKFSYSGFIYTKAQHDEMLRWFEKSHAWQMRDDLNRTFTIYVDTYTIDRVRSRTHRWKHEYSFSGIVLSEDT